MAVTTSYTVQKGDTLWGIAQKYGTTVNALLQANPYLNTAQRNYGNLIYPGDTIQIPQASGQDQAQSTVSKVQSTVSSNISSYQQPAQNLTSSTSYTVKSGDTLWGIAQKTGTTVEKLLEANPYLNTPARNYGNLIYPGDTIQIPSSAPVTQAQSNQSQTSNVVQNTQNQVTQEVKSSQSEATTKIASFPYTLPTDMTAAQIENLWGISHEQFQEAMQKSFAPDVKFRAGETINIPLQAKSTQEQDKSREALSAPAIILSEPMSLMDIASKYGIPIEKLMQLNPDIKDPNKKIEPGLLVWVADITKDVFDKFKAQFAELQLVPTIVSVIPGTIEAAVKPLSEAIQELIEKSKTEVSTGEKSAQKAIEELKEAFDKYHAGSENLLKEISLELYKRESEYWDKVEEQLAESQRIIADYILPALGATMSFLGTGMPGFMGLLSYFFGMLLASIGPYLADAESYTKDLEDISFEKSLSEAGVSRGQVPEVPDSQYLF